MEDNEFIDKYSINANDLYSEGIYDKACMMIKKYNKIFEVGCGPGYSTLSLICNGHKVFSIDNHLSCIEHTKKLLCDAGCEIVDKVLYSNEDATIMNANIKNLNFLNKIYKLDIDMIVLWNPGKSGCENIIKKCTELAIKMDKPIQIMEREINEQKAIKLLDDIAICNNVRLIEKVIIPFKWNYKDGIKLEGLNNEQIYIAIGMFFP